MIESGYIERTATHSLLRAVKDFPAVVLTGPRQSGKTTLLRHEFGQAYDYVSLEPPDIQMAAEEDPRGFVEAYKTGVIFDEIQYAPLLLPYIKEAIDADRAKKGRYLITGSQNLLLLGSVSETLAGRAAMLHLYPLSVRERIGQPQANLWWEEHRAGGARAGGTSETDSSLSAGELWETIVRGSYPELAAEPSRDAWMWYSSYVQTYLERDVRSLRDVGDLATFRQFLRVLASRNGQILDLAGIGRDLGIATNTVRAWMSVLEATFQIVIVRPYLENMTKRMVKRPKVYFTDTGTVCYLTGIRDASHAAAGPMGGSLFESTVLSEIVKTLSSRAEDSTVYYWRTSHGTEVDFVVEAGGKLIPIEVKTTATPKPAMAKGIAAFRELLGKRAEPGLLIHPGSVRLPLASGVTAVPFLAGTGD